MCGEGDLLSFAGKKRFEENTCGCRTLVLVCARFSPVSGTVERALCHLNPFNADCRLLCPHSEKRVITDHTDACELEMVQASLTAMDSGVFSLGCWSLRETGSAALGLFLELARADQPGCISECSTESPERNCWWR